MTIEEFKQTEEYKSFAKEQLKKTRITAVVVAVSMLIGIFFIVYSQIKTNEAEAVQAELEAQKELVVQTEKRANKAINSATKSTKYANAQNKATSQKLAIAEQKIKDLEKRLLNCQ